MLPSASAVAIETVTRAVMGCEMAALKIYPNCVDAVLHALQHLSSREAAARQVCAGAIVKKFGAETDRRQHQRES